MTIEINNCDETETRNRVSVTGHIWSLDGVGLNTLRVYTIPENAEWTFDGPGESRLTVSGIPQVGRWRLSEQLHTLSNGNVITNVLRITDTDQWILSQLDEDATKLTVHSTNQKGRWRFSDIYNEDELSGRLTVYTMPENGEWILKETEHTTNSLTVHGLPLFAKWKLQDYNYREDDLNHFDSINNLYTYDDFIYNTLTRDYRFINDRDLLIRLLQFDFRHHNYDFIISLNPYNDYVVDQQYIYRNHTLSTDDFFIYNIPLCRQPFMAYQLTPNQRLFINFNPSELVDSSSISSISDGVHDPLINIPVQHDEEPDIPSTRRWLLPFPGYFGNRYYINNVQQEDNVLFNHIKMILPRYNNRFTKVHLVHNTGLFDLSFVHEQIQRYSSEHHLDVFRDVVFTTRSATTNISSVGSVFYIDGNVIASTRDADNILNTVSIHNLGIDITRLQTTIRERLNMSYAIITGYENNNPTRIHHILNRRDVNIRRLNAGQYNIQIFDVFNRRSISINMITYETHNFQILLQDDVGSRYENINNKNLILYTDNQWNYKITNKFELINYNMISKIEEYKVLSVDCSIIRNRRRFFISRFIDDTFLDGSKAVIMFYNFDNTRNIKTFTLQKIPGMITSVNNETIDGWNINEIEYGSIDIYNDFLYKEDRISTFNYYYNVYIGDRI